MQTIRRAEKRGFAFDTDYVADLKSKTDEELVGFETSTIYEHAKYFNPEMNMSRVVSGTEGRRLERERATIRRLETIEMDDELPYEGKAVLNKLDILCDNLVSFANTRRKGRARYAYYEASSTIEAILNQAIESEGELRVAYRAQKYASFINRFIDRLSVNFPSGDPSALQGEFAELATILKGGRLSEEEMDSLNEEVEDMDYE